MQHYGIWGLLFITFFFWVFASLANPEKEIEDQANRIIHVQRKSFQNEESRGLIVPSALEDVESLAINPETQQWVLFREGQDPVELERSFQPALPWDLPHEHLIQLVSAHNFFLKELNDGSYKVDMKVPGLGGGRGNNLPRPVRVISKPIRDVASQQQAQVHAAPARNIHRQPVQREIQATPAPVPAKIIQRQPVHRKAQATPVPVSTKTIQRQLQPVQRLRGVNNPASKQALDIGNRVHKEFKDATEHLQVRNPLRDPQGRSLLPDLQTANMVYELKPATVSGCKKMHKQLQRYQDVSGKPGIGLFYNPYPGKPVPLDEMMRKTFPNDPIVQAVNPDLKKSRRSFMSKLSNTFSSKKSGGGSKGGSGSSGGSSSSIGSGSRGGGSSSRGGGGGNLRNINPKVYPTSVPHQDPFWFLSSSPCTFDLELPGHSFPFPYEQKVVGGQTRHVINYGRLIGMPQQLPPAKGFVKVQVNDYAIDPQLLREYLNEATLNDLPGPGEEGYDEYVNWARLFNHGNGVSKLITEIYSAPGFLYHADVIMDSDNFSESMDEACHNNVNLLNLSVGLDRPISEELKVALRRAKQQGMGIVVAAGNENKDFEESPFHGSLAEFALQEMDGYLLFVVGTQYTKEGRETHFRGGNFPTFAADLTISAPAGNILVQSPLPAGQEVSQGTSLSTALVTGAAALLKSQFPERSIKDIFKLLREGTRKTYLNTSSPLPPEVFGTGVLDIGNALFLTQATLRHAEIPNMVNWNSDGSIHVTTDISEANYQLISHPMSVAEDELIQIAYEILVFPGGKMSLGLLSTSRTWWYGDELVLGEGRHRGIYKRRVPPGETETSLVCRNYHLGNPAQSTFVIHDLEIKKENNFILKPTGNAAQVVKAADGKITVVTDHNANASYQLESHRFAVKIGEKIRVLYDITVAEGGVMALGLLNTARNGWLAEIILHAGSHNNFFEATIPGDEREISLVFRNYHLGTAGQTIFTLNDIDIKQTEALLTPTGQSQYVEYNRDGSITVATDDNALASYQLESERFSVQEDDILKVPYKVTVQPGGKMSLGWLSTFRTGWYGDELVFEEGTHQGIYKRRVPPGETSSSLVFRNYHLNTPGQTIFTIEELDIQKEDNFHLKSTGNTAQVVKAADGKITVTTDYNTYASYQLISERLPVTSGERIRIPYVVTVQAGGKIALGLLNTKRDLWYEEHVLGSGRHEGALDTTVPFGEREISLVFRNYHLNAPGQSTFTIDAVNIEREPSPYVPLPLRKAGNSMGSSESSVVEETGKYKVITDYNAFATYQLESDRLPVVPGELIKIPYAVTVEPGGQIFMGLLNTQKNGFYGPELIFHAGHHTGFLERGVPSNETETSLVFRNYHLNAPGQSTFTVDYVGLEAGAYPYSPLALQKATNSMGASGHTMTEEKGRYTVITDYNAYALHQLESDRILVVPGDTLRIPYAVTVASGGQIAMGLLNTQKNGFYGPELILTSGRHTGLFERRVPDGEMETSLVFRNYHLNTPGQSTFTVDYVGR